ncbi:YlxR family protein [bacterium]|nr:YlxR family protein [bacterium]
MQKEIKRKCQGCQKLFDRNELIKITKLPDGVLKINPSSKELGRSVYVCKNAECVQIFIKKKKLKTALKYFNMDEILRIEEELKKMING